MAVNTEACYLAVCIDCLHPRAWWDDLYSYVRLFPPWLTSLSNMHKVKHCAVINLTRLTTTDQTCVLWVFKHICRSVSCLHVTSHWLYTVTQPIAITGFVLRKRKLSCSSCSGWQLGYHDKVIINKTLRKRAKIWIVDLRLCTFDYCRVYWFFLNLPVFLTNIILVGKPKHKTM